MTYRFFEAKFYQREKIILPQTAEKQHLYIIWIGRLMSLTMNRKYKIKKNSSENGVGIRKLIKLKGKTDFPLL